MRDWTRACGLPRRETLQSVCLSSCDTSHLKDAAVADVVGFAMTSAPEYRGEPGRAGAPSGAPSGPWPSEAKLRHPIFERTGLEIEKLCGTAGATDAPP